MSRTTEEIAGHAIVLSVHRCLTVAHRMALAFHVARDAKLAVAADWALAKGYLSHGTTNASAIAHNRFQGEQLYLTRAGKAWLRELGGVAADFGSGMLLRDQLDAMSKVHNGGDK